MNYKSLLYEIQGALTPSGPIPETIILPSGKQLYEVDLNTRTIHGPEALSVQSDHYAETVYFVVDRYYDHMDLAQTNCVIQYTSQDNGYIYAVPFCDTTTLDGKIIIPWTISASATQNSGSIRYFMRFYLIDESSVKPENSNTYDASKAEFSYSLSTLTATSKILKTLPQDVFQKEDAALELPERYLELIDTLGKMVDNSMLYWIDV